MQELKGLELGDAGFIWCDTQGSYMCCDQFMEGCADQRSMLDDVLSFYFQAMLISSIQIDTKSDMMI